MQKKKGKGTSSRPARNRRRPAPARRKRRSPEEILNRIVEAAAGEFKRRGFTGTTTATIASKADVTEAQLFRYFGSKANLFRETIFKPLDQHFMTFIKRHVPSHKATTTREVSHLYQTQLQQFVREHSEMLMSLVVVQTYESGATQGVGKINSLNTFFDHATAAMKKSLLDKPKVEPALTARISFVAVLACVLFKDWIFPNGIASDAEIESAINTFVMEGLNANFGAD